MAVLDIRLVVCLQVMNFWVNGLRLPLPFQFDGVPVEKEVKITVQDDGSRFRRSVDGITIPARKLEVSFPVARTHVTLKLSRNDDVLPEVPVYTTNEDGIIVKEDIKDDHKAFYYQDITNGATVFVQTTQSSYCLFGSFFMDSEEFFLEPLQRECTDSLVNSTFRIWKADFSQLQYSDVRGRKLLQDKIVSGKHQRRSKRSVSEMKIETLFIIDYSIYNYWNSTVIVDNETDRARTTRSVIRQFYAFVINGMDVRYKSIPPYHDFTLSVVFAGIYIADTENKSPFTEEHKVVSMTTTTVDADDVLNHTTQWLQQTTGLPGFDHAMMFSRFDFTSNSSSSVSGLAWLGTMCKQDSVSIVEDHFNFIIMTVAAHELGHSLNAEHDGSNNECNSTSYFVMAPYVGVEKGLTNPWVFSNCSIQYFADLIEDLDETTNCLRTLASDHNPTALIPEINTLPGSVYDVNEHCRHIVGQNSQFCRAPYEGNFTDICTILYCFDNDGQNCNSYLGGDGIPCGNKKWCLSGVCTQSDLAAPAENEECLFGDDPAFEISSSGSIYSCNGSDHSQPISNSDCYDEMVRKRCCETCSSFYIGITGCEYGDKNEECASQHCDTDAATCCQTCSNSPNSTTEATTTTTLSTTLFSSTITSETTTEQMTTLVPSGTTSIDSTQSSPTITTTSPTETTAASTESMETSSSPSTTTITTTTTITEIPTTTTMLNTTPSEAAVTEPLTTTVQSTTTVPTTEGTSIRSTTTTTQTTTPPPTTTQTTLTTQTTTSQPTTTTLTTHTSTPPPTTTQTTLTTQTTTSQPTTTSTLSSSSSSSSPSSSSSVATTPFTTQTATQTSNVASTESTSTPTTTALPTTSSSVTTSTQTTTSRRMNFEISLNVNENRNLSNPVDYDQVVEDSKNALSNLYKKQLGDSFNKVKVNSVRTGSLVVDHDVFVENSPSVLLDVVNVMKNISTGKTNVTYKGNDVNALSVSYTDSSNKKVLIIDETDPNAVIDASYVCNSDDSCDRKTPTTDDEKGLSKEAIIIISSVAAGTALMVSVAVVLLICTCRHKPKTPTPTPNREYQHFLFNPQTTDILNKANLKQNMTERETTSGISHHQENSIGGHYARVTRVPTRTPDNYGYQGQGRAEGGKITEPDVLPTNHNWGQPYRSSDDYKTGSSIGSSGNSGRRIEIYESSNGSKDVRYSSSQTSSHRYEAIERDFRNLGEQSSLQAPRYNGQERLAAKQLMEATYLPNYESRNDKYSTRQQDMHDPVYQSTDKMGPNPYQKEAGYNTKYSVFSDRRPADDHGSRYTNRRINSTQEVNRPGYDIKHSQNKFGADPPPAQHGRRWYPGYEQYLSENDLWHMRQGPKYGGGARGYYNKAYE